ncbi:MAG: hypothetical protein HY717_07855, partial [Planctomycetes bacterium]|nr:hypothetical protein [Planctomycetota bacterium]
MVKTTSSQTGEPGGAWAGFQASFLQLFAELLKCSPEIDSLRKSAASGTQPGAENLKKLVTEAVGAVLIESQLIEKLVARALRN